MVILLIVWWDRSLEQISSVEKEMINLGHEPYRIGTLDHPHDFAEVLQEKLSRSPQLVIVWNRHANTAYIRSIYNGRLVLFNWDDPWCMINDETPCVKDYDCIYSSCKSTRNRYISGGAKSWEYLLPFFDPAVHYPDYDPAYECDVSLVITNLYSDKRKDRPADRTELIQALAASDLVFKLYGPAHIASVSPKNYCGEIGYDQSRKVFSSSKVNISTHAINGDGYVNERCITILGSGGRLLVDNVTGVHEVLGPNIFIIGNDIVQDVKNVISKPYVDSLSWMKSNYTCEVWVRRILAFSS